MTAIQQAQPPRFLGEGTVDKVYKRHMFVEDSKYGRIYVPLDAAQPSKPDVFDLREIFNVRDDVVLTAIRQQQKQQECNYCACSIVHRNELKTVQGKIVEMLDKYAYVDVPKYGRIFAPFSARTDGSRFWHGKNASVGKTVTMKILPQPEFHKCCYVAYAVYPDRPLLTIDVKDDGINFNTKCDRQPESVVKQIGMIVIEPNNSDEGLIYAQTTGSIAFSKSLLSGIKYETGDFVIIDAIKKVSNNYDKCFWSATHIDHIGPLPCVKSDVLPNRFNTAENCVTVDVYAIVCRSSHSNSSIWLWNDLLGRIFVNNHHYINDLHAMDVVTVKAQFTAAFEDVPWSAISVRPVHENVDQLREEYGQLMVTDDNWKVLHVCEQATGGFFGFMEHPTKGAAFMAWTDLNFGEVPPTKNSYCRVTVYNQHRDRRHPWRAILVTQLDPDTKKPIHEHPLYATTGQLHHSIQLQIRQQKATKQSFSTTTNGNVWTVPSATVTTPRIIAQHQTSSSNTSIDSGRASSGLINDSIATTPIDHPPGFTSAPLNTPIGAERALSQTNGDGIARAPSVEPFMVNDITDSFKLTTIGSSDNNKSYFNPWQSPDPFYFNSTWQPLNTNTTTPTLERRNTTNGFDSFRLGFSPSSQTSPNMAMAEMLKKKAQTDAATEEYEKFLCDEMLRRPHLLSKLISTNMDVQQLLISFMKQKSLSRKPLTVTMAAASTCTPPQRLSTSSTVDESQKRVPSKRISHHHHHPGTHFRPPNKSTERQRKIKRRPVNFVSTDGTTSGEGDDIQYSSELDIQARLEQLLRRPDQSDLEADCEDNNSTDVDTVSISGSIKHKNPIDNENSNPTDTKVELLCAKIRNLEKQLATVLSINIKLKEENDRLKNSVGQQ